ncbi:MAG: hypothetical protein ACRERU_21850 [Methylococcales bacterium]
MRSRVATKEFCSDLGGVGQRLRKSSVKAALAMSLRTSEKAKLVRPLTTGSDAPDRLGCDRRKSARDRGGHHTEIEVIGHDMGVSGLTAGAADFLLAFLESGFYDPMTYNDRLLLGLKGTMSEAELHILKQRMLEGKQAKTRRGELGIPVQMGYVRQRSGEVTKDPDEQAQRVIQRVFELFERKRTIQGVLAEWVAQQIPMPYRVVSDANQGDLVWRRPEAPDCAHFPKNFRRSCCRC